MARGFSGKLTAFPMRPKKRFLGSIGMHCQQLKLQVSGGTAKIRWKACLVFERIASNGCQSNSGQPLGQGINIGYAKCDYSSLSTHWPQPAS